MHSSKINSLIDRKPYYIEPYYIILCYIILYYIIYYIILYYIILYYIYIILYLTIILRGRAGYRMIDNQRGA